jgi:hypothetical protein
MNEQHGPRFGDLAIAFQALNLFPNQIYRRHYALPFICRQVIETLWQLAGLGSQLFLAWNASVIGLCQGQDVVVKDDHRVRLQQACIIIAVLV